MPLKLIILIKLFQHIVVPCITLLLAPLEQKLADYFLQNKFFKVPWEIEFWAILLQNWLKLQFSSLFKRWLKSKYSTNFSFEGVKKSGLWQLPKFNQNCIKMLLNIWSLQCYEVFSIHNSRMICISTLFEKYLSKNIISTSLF